MIIQIIADIIFHAIPPTTGCPTQLLARKVNTLYSLAIQQLSKQDHYDFGLRALVSVLKYGGRKKRANPDMPDEEVLLLAMKDMNVAKLTADDLPLFNGITSDLFPGVDVPLLDYGIVRICVTLQNVTNLGLLGCCVQLFS